MACEHGMWAWLAGVACGYMACGHGMWVWHAGVACGRGMQVWHVGMVYGRWSQKAIQPVAKINSLLP